MFHVMLRFSCSVGPYSRDACFFFLSLISFAYYFFSELRSLYSFNYNFCYVSRHSTQLLYVLVFVAFSCVYFFFFCRLCVFVIYFCLFVCLFSRSGRKSNEINDEILLRRMWRDHEFLLSCFHFSFLFFFLCVVS